MAIKVIDIRLARGNDEKRNIRLFNAKDEPLVMINGADDMFFTVKDKDCNDDIVFQKSLGKGGIKNRGGGKYSIRVKAEDTDELYGSNYEYDIKCVFANGNDTIRKTIFKGNCIISDTVTRISNESEE